MNLAARFSTSANMGDLDVPETRNALVWGNLALIQVQALVAGSIAGMFSVFLGAVLHPDSTTTVGESVLVIASSMVSATVSSLVLGVFMCILIILSRILKIDPGNRLYKKELYAHKTKIYNNDQTILLVRWLLL